MKQRINIKLFSVASFTVSLALTASALCAPERGSDEQKAKAAELA